MLTSRIDVAALDKMVDPLMRSNNVGNSNYVACHAFSVTGILRLSAPLAVRHASIAHFFIPLFAWTFSVCHGAVTSARGLSFRRQRKTLHVGIGGLIAGDQPMQRHLTDLQR